jgi:hypothetical protein
LKKLHEPRQAPNRNQARLREKPIGKERASA